MLTPLHIKLAMTTLGMTNADLGNEIDVSGQTVGALVGQRHGTNSRTMAKIETFFREKGIIFLEAGELSAGGGIGIRLK